MEDVELRKGEPHGLAHWFRNLWSGPAESRLRHDDGDVALMILREVRALRAEVNDRLRVVLKELRAGQQPVLQEQRAQRAEIAALKAVMQEVLKELRAQRSEVTALPAVVQAARQEQQAETTKQMRAMREALQKSLATLRAEVRTLRADTIAVAEQRQPSADPQLLEDCLQWLVESGDWHTSAGVACGVSAPPDDAVRVLRELVLTCQIDNRQQGSVTVYRAFSAPEAEILEWVRMADCTRVFLAKHCPHLVPLLDELLESLTNRGKVRSVGQSYRFVDPLPLEELHPRADAAEEA